MSERSFRAQAPEDHARERAASLMDVTIDGKPENPKQKRRFSIPVSVRLNSQQQRAKGVSPGVIQPLPQQQSEQKEQKEGTPITTKRRTLVAGAVAERRRSQHKLKTSMRDSALDPRRDSSKERERLTSPTHSAMRLPQHSGIGSASSSIRSFQTDLSSIAEDQRFDYNQHGPMNPKLSAHLLPIKSAMKGGSGPPSIISEALSEESKSSLGAHDLRKGKARVSFSDEQEQNNTVGAGPSSNWTATNGAQVDGFLKPAPPIVVGKPTERPASPPISPRVPTILPPPTTTHLTSPPTTTQSTMMTQSTVEEPQPPTQQDETPLPEVSPAKEFIVPNNVVEEEPTLDEQNSNPVANNTPTPQVTIHVSPTKSTTPTSRLPGSFPDPTPDPTPPSTADSDSHEHTDTLSPLRTQTVSAVPADDPNLQPDASMRKSTLAPTSARPGGVEKMVRRQSAESGGSGASVYSDAKDDLPTEKKESKIVAQTQKEQQNSEALINGPGTMAGTATAAAFLASSPISGKPSSPKEPQTKPIARRPVSSMAPRPQSMPPVKSPSMKTTKPDMPYLSSGTVNPEGNELTSRTNLRENSTSHPAASAAKSKRKPIKTSLRASSVPPSTSPTSPLSPDSPGRERKRMPMSLRANDRETKTASADMARGLMSLPALERVPSDSSFKRLKPRDQNVNRTTLRRPPKQEVETKRLRRDSDSSDDIFVPGSRRRSSSIFGRLGKGRRHSIDTPAATASLVTTGSRFADSSDDEELTPPPRGVGRAYEDTESPPPRPIVSKLSSFPPLFRRGGGRKDDLEPMAVVVQGSPGTRAVDGMGEHRRSTSESETILSKRTGKEKRFQGLRKLFRIKE